MNCCVIVYHVIDNNVFETCLRTLRKVSDCEVVVFTDNVPPELMKRWTHDYGVAWIVLPKSAMQKRRAACKIECVSSFVEQVEIGHNVISADADLYFLKDPFTAFEYEFDLGLTTRGYKYYYPINAGVIFHKVSPAMKDLYSFMRSEVLDPTWPEYVAYKQYWGHERFGLDWAVGQDLYNVAWLHQNFIWENFGIEVRDVGPYYNFCPHSDGTFIEEGKRKAVEAYKQKSVSVIHLKSKLKDLVYEDVFDDAITIHERGPRNWMKNE